MLQRPKSRIDTENENSLVLEQERRRYLDESLKDIEFSSALMNNGDHVRPPIQKR